jgi:hypothetical protein
MAADWYSEQPRNRNFLTPVGFRLDLEIFDGVDFFCQSASIPELSAPFAEVPTPYRNVPIVASGGTNFGDLVLRFIVDEDLVNYKSIHDWIRKYTLSDGRSDEADLYSSARLFILTSHNNSSHYVEFNNIFPINITGIPFDATVSDIDYLSAEVIFKYESYNIIPIVQPDLTSTVPLSVSLTNDATDILDPGVPFTLTYNSSGAETLVIDKGVGNVVLTASSVRIDSNSIDIDDGDSGPYDAEIYKVDTDDPSYVSITYTITAIGSDGSSAVTASTTIRFKRLQTSANRVCIAVIDENDNNSLTSMESKWAQFKSNWPERNFFLLQPASCASPTSLNAPLTFMEQTDPSSINNPCASTLITTYDSNYGLYLSTSQGGVETPEFNNGTVETTIDDISKYGVFRMGLEQGCGDMSDIVALFQNATNLSKVLLYVNNGGVLWINAEWIRGACSNQANVNTILTLLGSAIQMDGDLATTGDMNRSNHGSVTDAAFPATLFHNATGKFTGGIPIYQVTNGGTTHDTFVYEKIGNGVLAVSADVNTYQDNTYTLRPPNELYSSLRRLVA